MSVTARVRPGVAVCGAVWSLLALPAAAQVDIHAVTLSTGGIALIEATANAGPEGVALNLRRADIDDFLKSVVVSDPAGALPLLRLAGPGAFDDAFAALPFDPSQLADPARLLSAMTGAPLLVERRGVQTRGTVVGVSERSCDDAPCHVLTLRDADGALRSVDLDAAVALTFTDAADQAMLDAALAAFRTGAGAQQIALAIDSDDASVRDIGLAWLQSAPVWKTAWRAVDSPEGLALTGWAVVENTTGQDWDEVELTLATGAVQALYAPLYDRIDTPRAIADARELAFAPAMAETALRSALGAADHGVADMRGDDGDSFTRFVLAQPVTLAAGDMISLPFLRETLTDARLLVHRGRSGLRHPMLALELENPLPLRLPAGVLTLYEHGRGHAGDAMVPELAPGARALVDFARDTAVTISEDTSQAERVREIRIRDGVMEVTEDLERRTRYRIEGAEDRDRTITLDHPLDPGWQVVTQGGTARMDAMRWQVDVAQGAIVTHDIHERQPRMRRIGLADLDGDALTLWLRDAPDDEARALLADLAALRQQIEELRRQAEQLRTREADLTAEQARLVDLIVALGADSAADRDRRARVDALDALIAEAVIERRAAQAEIDTLRARIAVLLGS